MDVEKQRPTTLYLGTSRDVSDKSVLMADKKATEKTWPDIPEFFNGKTVLITGATGFVGKVLLEKLLRSCRGIEEVFLLIRPTADFSVEDRLDNILDCKLFDKIHELCPEVLKKIVAIPSDILYSDLGLDTAEKLLIRENVSVVFHSAASVKFEGPASESLGSNLLGTKNLLDACHKMKKLEAFVHVSTAYSFCNFEEITENVYPEKYEPSQLVAMLDWMPNVLLDRFTNSAKKGRPFVYHYSKAMAELYLSRNRKEIPVSIVRPSMITATWREPFPGWIDSRSGPNGMIAACIKGVIRSVYVKPTLVADLIPVDIVVNTIIAAARETALQKREHMLIVNCTSLPENYITWGKVENICYPLIVKYPSNRLFRHPGGSFKKYYWTHALSLLKSHWLPAFLVCVACPCSRPMMICIYGKVHKLLSQFEFFTTRKFSFQTQNRRRIDGRMSSEDKIMFPMVMNEFTWEEYMENYVLGIRRYLLKENDETLPKARSKMIRSYCLWFVLKYSPVVLGLWYLQERTGMVTSAVSHLRSLMPTHMEPRLEIFPKDLICVIYKS